MTNDSTVKSCTRLGCYFVPGVTPADCIVYLPAAKATFKIRTSDVHFIVDAASAYLAKKKCEAKLYTLFEKSQFSLARMRMQSKQSGMESILYISPTSRCNFKCTYCYSKSGRSTNDIDVSLAKEIVAAFIQTRNISINSVRIVFIGGGEPLLNFSAVSQLTSFAKLCAAKRNMNIVVGVITNGSLLNDTIIPWFDKENVRLNISFEILPDEQTRLRGNFIEVMNAIKLLQSYSTVCSHTLIRSTLTESNVHKQLEMLRYAKMSMPWISKYSVEPVTDASFLSDYNTAISFLSTFKQEYEKAKDFASRVEFKLSTSFDSHVGRFIDHACAGQFGVTPYGAITSCGCMTSPYEPYYGDTLLKDTFDDFVGFFQSNHKRVCPITQQCESCYARYCCAGGCFIQNKLYDMNVKKAICTIQKEFLRRFLIKTTYREQSV